jgi:hypothetical protein
MVSGKRAGLAVASTLRLPVQDRAAESGAAESDQPIQAEVEGYVSFNP